MRVIADHDLDSMGVAGTFVGSLQQGIGAAADLKVLDKRVHAHIDPAPSSTSRTTCWCGAVSTEDPDAIVVGLTAALDIGLAGSVAFTKLDKETFAFIDGATVRADGNVVLQRGEQHASSAPTAGAGALGLTGGVGVSGSLLMKADDTRAYITGSGRGRTRWRSATRSRSSPGRRTRRATARPAARAASLLSATNQDVADPIAVGGAVGLLAAVAGSGAGAITDNHVAAYIDGEAQVNQDDAGALAAAGGRVCSPGTTPSCAATEGAISAALLAAASATFDYARRRQEHRGLHRRHARRSIRAPTSRSSRARPRTSARSAARPQLGFALVSGTLVGAVQTIVAETRAGTQRGSRVTAAGDVVVVRRQRQRDRGHRGLPDAHAAESRVRADPDRRERRRRQDRGVRRRRGRRERAGRDGAVATTAPRPPRR